jgi:uncharacterized protein (DUF3084 family)
MLHAKRPDASGLQPQPTRPGAEHVAELETRREQLEQREREVAAREDELARSGSVDVAWEQLRRREEKIVAKEEALAEQRHELSRQESLLDEREAQLLVDAELRDESLEERARELEERELRLSRREDELVAYVAQVQGRLGRPQSVDA